MNNIYSIGTNRQLFLDEMWLTAPNNISRKLHSPDRREAVIEADYPWEKGFVGSATVSYDGEKYTMWYKCEDSSIIGVPMHSYRKRAYAESNDGINWTKPFLRQMEFEGSNENNLLVAKPGVVGLDKNPDAKEEDRFKAFKVVPTQTPQPKIPNKPTWQEKLDQTKCQIF